MPDRIVRDELLTSERYWSTSPEARNLYVSILLSADDTGRYTAANFALRTKCMAGTVNSERIEKLLMELVDVDLVRLYEDGGARYLFIPRYRQKLRYTNSKYPAPPDALNDIDESEYPDLSPQEWGVIRLQVLDRDGYACIRCQTKTGLTAYHMLPRSKGGKSTMDNLSTLCKACNSWARTNEERCNEIIRIFRKKHCLSISQAMPELAEVKRREEVPSPRPPVVVDTASTWEAYRAAYAARWLVDPKRNATVNSQIKSLVGRLGADSPAVAAFYISHNDRFYVQKRHPTGLLLKDAEGLYQQWKTGTRATSLEARSAEQKDAVREQINRVASNIERKAIEPKNN